jgi:16S rRNA (cytosine967-C5)-methyltransferase
VTGQKPRQIAVRALRKHQEAKDYIENVLARELASAALRADDRSLALELTYGVVRWQATLDWLIARKTLGRTQKPLLQILLRLGLYQLFWLDRIPDHAAVHETVELAREFGFGPQTGFINAILRGYVREKAATRHKLEELKITETALGFSHPEWLCVRWANRWGAKPARQLMEWNNTPAKTYARVNTLRVEPYELLRRWREEENVEYDFVIREWLDENTAFLLKSHPPLETLRSFQEGWFYVQDPSTLLAVRVLDPQPAESVLDLCAAPGGKTTYVAQRMRNTGRIVAEDHLPERLDRVKENCARLGVTCVDAQLTSDTPLSALSAPHFDRVLVDAPCSNTGVMRRRVDLRWRLSSKEIERSSREQLKLLRRAAAEVKPGGTLVYSTCSLEPEENQNVVREFLSEHRRYTLEAERELTPFNDGVDGTYVARLVQSAPE